MKTEFLKEAGLTDEQISRVMAENGRDVETIKARLTAKEAELAAANASIGELTGKLKAFDGVDVEGLKKSAADWQSRYDADIAKLRFDGALDAALGKAGARNVKAVKALIDAERLKLDGETVIGLDEQLGALKKDEASAFLFQPAVSTGMRQTGTPAGENGNDTANAAFRSLFAN